MIRRMLVVSLILGFFFLMNTAWVLAEEKLVIAGTGDSQILLRNMKKAFERKHPECRVVVPESIGSSGGINSLIKNRTNLARTARPLKEIEKSGLIEYLFAKSPVVFAVHPSVKGVTDLSAKQLVGIYTGKYRNWKEVGGPDAKIYPVDRGADDSSRQLFNRSIPGFKGKSVGLIFYSVPETTKAIADHKFTIGMLPLSAAKDEDLTVLSIDGVFPTDSAYLYVTPLYIVSRGQPRGMAKQFIEFLYSAQAHQLMEEIGIVPAK